ncbi:DUF433 domain-containing protein [Maribacter cobaltidurans]|uniref:Uncharacterized protein n=1 Tax=Maribacter cobaltidurans TaxID=1178778 RepID=A0A223V6C9_9FLAO|nr:DUF433 domain-containing protein [Maribacter cobaltidurans]ASV30558.1 hypothetical protein CJ263_10235 [Maribacter cobaltidurans]GGD79773.1 hypothetical protein GCM10011412_16960 [Maribacter cobaltidurans]
MVREKLELGAGIYTITSISDILKIKKNKISHIFNYYYNYKLEDSSNHKYLLDIEGHKAVNFLSLVEIKIFYTLREHGIKYPTTFKAHEFLSKELKTPYPFAHHEILISGSDILFELDSKDLIKADESKQTAIKGIVLPFCKKIEYNSKNIAKSYYPLGKEKSIIIDPEHQFGEPTIKNTNILVQSVAEMYNAGDSKELISNIYNLNYETINDAISYYNQSA